MRTYEEKVQSLENFIATESAKIGRACGECSLCCKLLPIKKGEGDNGFAKPANEWCKHCEVGKGCKIYADRPTACRGFTCMWLCRGDVPEYWYPLKSKMVLVWVPFIRKTQPQNALEIHVDPGFPNRWREEPWHSSIREASQRGLENGTFTTFLLDGKQRLLILPNKEVVAKGRIGMIRQIGPNEWTVLDGTQEQLDAMATEVGR